MVNPARRANLLAYNVEIPGCDFVVGIVKLDIYRFAVVFIPYLAAFFHFVVVALGLGDFGVAGSAVGFGYFVSCHDKKCFC